MVRAISGSVVAIVGLTFIGPAGAQGFSGGGVAGVAAMRGTTASPGYAGAAAGGAADGPVARARRMPAEGQRRIAPVDVDLAPWGGRPGPADR